MIEDSNALTNGNVYVGLYCSGILLRTLEYDINRYKQNDSTKNVTVDQRECLSFLSIYSIRYFFMLIFTVESYEGL
jgi:hypothetical protein